MKYPVRWLLLALAVGGAVGWLADQTRTQAPALAEELEGLRVGREVRRDLERRWIADGFEREFLLSPRRRATCLVEIGGDGIQAKAHEASEKARPAAAWQRAFHEDPGNVDAALALAEAAASEGDERSALLVLRRALSRPRSRAELRSVVGAVRAGDPSLGPPTEQVVPLLQALRMYSRLSLEIGRWDAESWFAAKNPIACARLLVMRGVTGFDPSQPSWSRLDLPAPGCPVYVRKMSTYDLYNDLMVAYVLHPEYEGSAAARRREFRRRGEAPKEDAPVRAALEHLAEDCRSTACDKAHLIWALSNAERLLAWVSGPPEDVRLCVNLLSIFEELDPAWDRRIREGLRPVERGMVEMALSRASREADELSAAVKAQLARHALRMNVDQPDQRLPLSRAWLADISPQQRQLAEDIERVHRCSDLSAEEARDLLVQGEVDACRPEEAGRASEWAKAARVDLRQALSREVQGASGARRYELVRQAKRLEARGGGEAGDSSDPARAGMGSAMIAWWVRRARASVLVGPVAGLAAFLLTICVTRWVDRQLRYRDAVLGSAYSEE